MFSDLWISSPFFHLLTDKWSKWIAAVQAVLLKCSPRAMVYYSTEISIMGVLFFCFWLPLRQSKKWCSLGSGSIYLRWQKMKCISYPRGTVLYIKRQFSLGNYWKEQFFACAFRERIFVPMNLIETPRKCDGEQCNGIQGYTTHLKSSGFLQKLPLS